VSESNLRSGADLFAGLDRLMENSLMENRLMGNSLIVDSMFSSRGGLSGFIPMAIPVLQTNRMFPFTMHPQADVIKNAPLCDCGCDKGASKTPGVEVDDEMSMRRELNVQLRAAIENEEFEKAAVLRDKIKELEAGRSTICDSETDSQGSQTAQ
jgi:hypothetical protein